jgi:hypothetical protein
MKQNVPMKRSRGHSSNGRSKHHASRSIPSDGNQNGGRVRGNSQQVLDKYLAMARDAMMAGDRVAAEGFFQHAEHYYRVVHECRKSDKANPVAGNTPPLEDVPLNIVAEERPQSETSSNLDGVEDTEPTPIPA